MQLNPASVCNKSFFAVLAAKEKLKYLPFEGDDTWTYRVLFQETISCNSKILVSAFSCVCLVPVLYLSTVTHAALQYVLDVFVDVLLWPQGNH